MNTPRLDPTAHHALAQAITMINRAADQYNVCDRQGLHQLCRKMNKPVLASRIDLSPAGDLVTIDKVYPHLTHLVLKTSMGEVWPDAADVPAHHLFKADVLCREMNLRSLGTWTSMADVRAHRFYSDLAAVLSALHLRFPKMPQAA